VKRGGRFPSHGVVPLSILFWGVAGDWGDKEIGRVDESNYFSKVVDFDMIN
jgi:hypothetical protein